MLEGVGGTEEKHEIEQIPLSFDGGVGGEALPDLFANISPNGIPSSNENRHGQQPIGQATDAFVEGIDKSGQSKEGLQGAIAPGTSSDLDCTVWAHRCNSQLRVWDRVPSRK